MVRILRILSLSSWLSWFGTASLGPIYAIFVERIGGNILDAGAAWAVFSIVMGLLMMGIGRIEDRRFDRRKILTLGYSIITLATLGYLFVRNPYQLLGIQALLGIGTALYYPTWDTLFSHAIEKDRESTEWALQEGGYQISGGIAALVGSFIAGIYGFQALFITMASIQATSVIASLFLFSKKYKHLENAKISKKHKPYRKR